MEQELQGKRDVKIIWPLAWAGTEAARVLRSIHRNAQADTVAVSLKERFGGGTEKENRRALAYAAVERYKTCSSAGDFDAASNICTQFIEQWDAVGSGPEIEFVMVWAYAQ